MFTTKKMFALVLAQEKYSVYMCNAKSKDMLIGMHVRYQRTEDMSVKAYITYSSPIVHKCHAVAFRAM